jgi:putative hydroxymethylpyrimidine transport system permease protein
VSSARRTIAPAVLLLALIGLWELYVDLHGVDTLILPAPHAIAAALFTDRSTLWSNFLVTAQEVVFGIGVGVGAALAMAVLIHFSQIARRAVYPLLIASQAVPIPILAPVLVLWLGFGIGPKVVVIALVSFFPIVVTTLAALATVDPSLLKLMRTFDASRLRTFRHVEMPSALPGVVTGAKLAAVFSVIGAVLGEEAGASHGLGYLLTIASSNYEMAEAFAAVAILSAFAIALFLALSVFERRALPWAYRPIGDAH